MSRIKRKASELGDLSQYTQLSRSLYEVDEKTCKDLIAILLSFLYVDGIELKCKHSFKSLSRIVKTLCKLLKKSVPFDLYDTDNYDELHKTYPILNMPSKIGSWLWEIGVEYPNFIFKIFPPPFGHNFTDFIDIMFTALNNFDMPKSDWDTLLNATKLTEDELDAARFEDVIEQSGEILYHGYLAESFKELKLKFKRN